MNKLRNVLFEELAQHSKADAQCEKTMMSAIGTKLGFDEVVRNGCNEVVNLMQLSNHSPNLFASENL